MPRPSDETHGQLTWWTASLRPATSSTESNGSDRLARVAWKEFRLGLLLGSILGVCIAATAILIDDLAQ